MTLAMRWLTVSMCPHKDNAAVQSQKAVSADFTSKQILPFGFAEQNVFCILVVGFPYDTSGCPVFYKNLFILYFAIVFVISVCVKILKACLHIRAVTVNRAAKKIEITNMTAIIHTKGGTV